MRTWRKAAALFCVAAVVCIYACAYKGYELMPRTQRREETQYPFLGMDLPILPDEVDVVYWLTVPATGEKQASAATAATTMDHLQMPWETMETQAAATTWAQQRQGARLNRGIGIAPRVIADVYRYLAGHTWSANIGYETQPHVGAPYTLGRLDAFTKQGAINHTNAIRYIAGLPEVAWDTEKEESAQAAAVILAKNKVLTHNPAQPADMPWELYRQAYDACGSSNLANAGNRNTLHRSVNMFLEDSDPTNIDELAHRRWMLNPAMGKTAFGVANTYCAMTATDSSAPADPACGVVMYPAQVQPTAYFGADWAWTVSFADDFNIHGSIKVTLVRRGDGRGWELSSRDGRDGLLIRSTNAYGQPNCLIFRPSGFTLGAGDVIDIQIEGVARGGQAHLVQYTVQFI
jgi:uncharacterized protein YkwD